MAYLEFADLADAENWLDAANGDIGVPRFYGVDRLGDLVHFETLKELEDWHQLEWEAPLPEVLKKTGKPGKNSLTGRWAIRNQRDESFATLIEHQDRDRPDPADRDKRVVAWVDPDSVTRDSNGVDIPIKDLPSNPVTGRPTITQGQLVADEFIPTFEDGDVDVDGNPMPDQRDKEFNSPEPGEKGKNGQVVPGGPARTTPAPQGGRP